MDQHEEVLIEIYIDGTIKMHCNVLQCIVVTKKCSPFDALSSLVRSILGQRVVQSLNHYITSSRGVKGALEK